MSEQEETRSAYPLEWPAGWPRTPFGQRRRAKFSKRVQTGIVGYARNESLTLSDGLQRLERELRRLGVRNVVISSNLQTTADGRPYTRQPKMLSDPGVAVYFRLKGKALALACDRWQSAAENMAALAGHIEAIRACDRYGVGSIEQALAGYRALPADSAADWRTVLGFPKDSRPSTVEVERRFKELAREKHPDMGGTDAGFSHISRARDFAHAELTGSI